MIKQIVGGIVTVAIGGTVYSVNQANVVDNLSKNTGMTQQQAQSYVDNSQKDLESFSKIGHDTVTDGNALLDSAAQIDCINYTYEWESPSLSCTEGVTQLQALANDEIVLGNCFIALDTNLGGGSRAKINECITDIDVSVSDYELPVASKLMSSSEVTDAINSSKYNKSVLQAALQAN